MLLLPPLAMRKIGVSVGPCCGRYSTTQRQELRHRFTLWGDEFLIVLPETDGETELVKERILAEGARRNKAHPLLDFPVTLAIGSVHWNPDSGQSMEEALAEADRLMYEDKEKQAESDQ